MTEPAVRWLTEPEMLAWQSLVRATTGLLAMLDNDLRAEHGLTFGDYEVSPDTHRNARTASIVSASAEFLSGRYPFTRANRSATPPG